MSLVTTLGMFIIDENRYLDGTNTPPQTDIIGGAGPYAIIGSRIVCPTSLAHRISGIIDTGTDFPSLVRHEIDTWGTGHIFRTHADRLTTRGVNTYRHGGRREFAYLTPRLRIEAEDIATYPALRQSRTYHLICSVGRARALMDALKRVNPDAVFIYEPLPDDCVAEKFGELKGVLRDVHVFSPNLDEGKSFLGWKDSDGDVGEIARRFTEFMEAENSGTVLRCGAEGCFIRTVNGMELLLPAYHQDQRDVVDVTGGGNSFCGGFIMGFCLSNGDWTQAGIAGNISSGCIIEKLGMPEVSGDVFNGKTLKERLEVYRGLNPGVDVELDWI
ncbi:Protein MAK32 [Candida viswanathii]|uniref:Protein MAK32 n=1 Tax=Candida viswanathii TaxID=5486 RepID=A0A367XTE7_9ASCO|nr:Protein MAK32 [Candida viswanathii]